MESCKYDVSQRNPTNEERVKGVYKETATETQRAGAGTFVELEHIILPMGGFLIKIPLSFGPSEAPPPQAIFLMLHSKEFCRLRHR